MESFDKFHIMVPDFIYATLCGFCFKPHKLIELCISKNYLTTNDPSLVRIQKIQKIRKFYSPDPEFRKFKTKFFLKFIVVNICSQIDLL